MVRKKITQISLETIIGVSYAITAAGALFLIAMSTEGHLHVEHMLAGSILWAKWSDVILCAAVFSVVGFVFYLFRKPFKKISDNYQVAVTGKIKVVWWDFLFYSLFGIVITLSVRIAGVLVVFAFLIIPATISAMFSSRLSVRLLIAWLLGTVVSIMGLVFSYYLDFSMGPSVVSFLGLTLIVIAVAKKIKLKVG